MVKTKSKTKEDGQRLSELIIFRASPAEATTVDKLARKVGRNRSEVMRGLIKKIRA